MEKRLFDVDHVTGAVSYFHYDDLTDTTRIETVHSQAGLNQGLQAAQELRNDEDYTRKGMKSDALHYAWIPDELLLKWHAQGIDIKDRKELFKMVNKPEYQYLKTTNMVHR